MITLLLLLATVLAVGWVVTPGPSGPTGTPLDVLDVRGDR